MGFQVLAISAFLVSNPLEVAFLGSTRGQKEFSAITVCIGPSLYILRCADGKLYTGLTRRDVDERVSEHQQGLAAFTKTRLPVTLIFSEHYLAITDAIAAERQIKGWTRAKKLAYAAGDFERLSVLARRGGLKG